MEFFFVLGKRTCTPLSAASTQAHKVLCDVSGMSIDSTIRRGGHSVSRCNYIFCINFIGKLYHMYIKFLTILLTSGTPHSDVTTLGSLPPLVNGSVCGVANTDKTSNGTYLIIVIIKSLHTFQDKIRSS